MSDRCLVLLDMELGNFSPSPFRFENMWITHMDFYDLVDRCWKDGKGKGWAAQKFVNLKHVKKNLKLEPRNFWHIGLKKNLLIK